MATRVLKVEITGDARGFQRAVNDIEGHTKRLAGGFTKATTLIGAGFAALGGTAIISGIKGLVDEAREAEKIGRQTAAVIKSTGGVANVSAKDIDRLTSSLSNKVGVDDDLIASGANLLLTFKNVRNETGRNNDIFNQATKAAVDMAAAMNQGEVTAEGLKSANIQLGKALNDPVAGLTALTRVGVTFTDAQKKQIQTLVTAGRTMDAQKIILKELADEFGGAAEAASDPWQRFGVKLGNIKETIGGALLPALNNAVTFVNDKLIPAAEAWYQDHAKQFAEAFDKVKNAANDFWALLRDHLWPSLEHGSEIIDEELKPQLDRLKQSWEDNSDSIKQLTNRDLKPLGATVFPLAAAGATLMIGQVDHLIKYLGSLGNFVRALKVALAESFRFIGNAFLMMVSGILHGAEAIIASIPGGKRSGFAATLRRGIDNIADFRQSFNHQMDMLHGKKVNVTATGVWVPPKGMGSIHDIVGGHAAGGPIIGAGTSTSDSIPAMLSTGEHVLSAREVQGMGGHAAVEQMRRSARGFAAGGGVGVDVLASVGGVGAKAQNSIDRLAAAIDRLTVRIPISGANIPHVAGAWQMALSFLRSVGVPYDVVSTFRPGARTHASGAVSFHALNRAVDLTGPNMLRIWDALTHTNPTELIYSGASMYKSRSGWHPIGRLDPITLADHWSHVHAAYDRGGWLEPGWTMAWNGTGRPERVSAPGGGGGISVSFYGPVYGDRRALTETVRQGIREALRREGRPVTV